jgi:uroporphyrinogen decarboxylase
MKREIFCSALEHTRTEIVPHYFALTQGARRKVIEHYGETYKEEIGNYMSVYFLDRPDEWKWVNPDVIQDMWGVRWDRSVDKDIGVPVSLHFPEPDMRYWDPPPIQPSLFEPVRAFIRESGDTFKMISLSFFTLYDRAWTLRGIENLLTDMALNPAFVDELFEAITDWSIRAVKGILEVPGVDGILFSDDWGQQTGLTMGKSHWVRFIQPCLRRLFKAVKDGGKWLSIHSCGRVQELFPMLIDLGLDLFNPFQPEVMDVESILQSYRGKLAFWGGLSVQRTLPRGTPDDVRREVKKLWELGKNGGYVLSPSHDLTPDIPTENLVALIETVKELEKKALA